MAKRIAVALALLAATLLVLVLYLPRMEPAPPVSMASGTVAIGGPFTLIDVTGKAVTDADLKGRYSLIYFGFTHCPDICPLTLQNMTAALAAASKDVQPVFITVDPERDTPEAMASYMASFDPRFIALTGTPDQVKAAEQSYKVYAVKEPVKDAAGQPTADYTMTHTGYIYLMDKSGNYLAHFSSGASADEIAQGLGKLPA